MKATEIASRFPASSRHRLPIFKGLGSLPSLQDSFLLRPGGVFISSFCFNLLDSSSIPVIPQAASKATFPIFQSPLLFCYVDFLHLISRLIDDDFKMDDTSKAGDCDYPPPKWAPPPIVIFIAVCTLTVGTLLSVISSIALYSFPSATASVGSSQTLILISVSLSKRLAHSFH